MRRHGAVGCPKVFVPLESRKGGWRMKKRILVLLSVVALMVASVSPALAAPQTFTGSCFNPATGEQILLLDAKKNAFKKLEKQGFLCVID